MLTCPQGRCSLGSQQYKCRRATLVWTFLQRGSVQEKGNRCMLSYVCWQASAEVQLWRCCKCSGTDRAFYSSHQQL